MNLMKTYINYHLKEAFINSLYFSTKKLKLSLTNLEGLTLDLDQLPRVCDCWYQALKK